MGHISDNLYHIHAELTEAASKASRDPAAITLLCVSKTKPESDIIEAYQSGERSFGESYVNEAVPKIQSLKNQGYTDIHWHFIGPLQSNKTRPVAENFDCVESVDRLKVLQRLNDQRPEHLPPLEILIEVNISHEEQKSGCDIEELPMLIEGARNSPRLILRGLMGIATDTQDKDLIHSEFEILRALFDKYRHLPSFNILSMGMTHDMDEAIACGSTEIRIGTAIFGPRNYPNRRQS